MSTLDLHAASAQEFNRKVANNNNHYYYFHRARERNLNVCSFAWVGQSLNVGEYRSDLLGIVWVTFNSWHIYCRDPLIGAYSLEVYTWGHLCASFSPN